MKVGFPQKQPSNVQAFVMLWFWRLNLVIFCIFMPLNLVVFLALFVKGFDRSKGKRFR